MKMQTIDWDYRKTNDAGHWQRSVQLEAEICRISWDLRMEGYDAEVDRLWWQYGPARR